jgi:hypothetical protein
LSVLHLLDGNLLDGSFTRSLTPFELDGKKYDLYCRLLIYILKSSLPASSSKKTALVVL